jgi:hypothetical protein
VGIVVNLAEGTVLSVFLVAVHITKADDAALDFKIAATCRVTGSVSSTNLGEARVKAVPARPDQTPSVDSIRNVQWSSAR